MLNWKNSNDYLYTQSLSTELWAWEFLRRNPEYRSDWETFNTRWKGLEADYGKAPNRDFPRWKNDPRAYISEQDAELICPDDLGISCVIEDNKVLIECWMGAKWGFYKFPLNPSYTSPKVPDELLWREKEINFEQLQEDSNSKQAYIATLSFDLRFSLKEQLEMARIKLAKQRRTRQKAGQLKARIQDNVNEWTILLRFADAIDEGVEVDKAISYLCPYMEADLSECHIQEKLQNMFKSGYLDILLMKN